MPGVAGPLPWRLRSAAFSTHRCSTMSTATPLPSRSGSSISGSAGVKISVIITTYNRPDALRLVLRGLAAQSAENFEVLVADDGSTGEPAGAIGTLRARLPYGLTHVWQADDGFRAPMAR